MAEVMGGQQQVEALAAIAMRDPAFDVHSFLSQAAATYLEVQQARAAGTPDAVADVVAAAARTQLGLEHPHAPGPYTPPELGELSVVQASTDASWDSIVVRIPTLTGGTSRTEDWCFQRPESAKSTTASEAAVCSSCGAPRQATASGVCRFCGTVLSPPNGWTVTRVASIAEPAPPSGQKAADLAAAITAMIQAAAEQQRSGRPATVAAKTSAKSKASGCGCLLVLLLVVGVPATILGVAAATPSSGLHRTLSFLPFLQRGYIDGQAQLTGAVTTSGKTGNFVPGVNQCAKVYLKNKQLNFSGVMQDGSTLTVKADSLNGGAFGTTDYTNNSEIEISPSLVTKSGATQQWAPNSTTHTSFVLSGSGSGQLMVTDYAPSLSGPGVPTGPLTLTISWTCRNR